MSVAFCTGDEGCVADRHIHGCYADVDRDHCMQPDEHPDDFNPFNAPGWESEDIAS